MSTPLVSQGSKQSVRLIRRILVALAAVALLAVLPFLSGLIGALMLFVLARPLHERLSRHVPRRVAAFTFAIAALALLFVPGAWLLTTVIAEGTGALASLRTTGVLARTIQTPIGPVDLAATLAGLGSTVMASLSGRALALFGGATTTMLNVLIAVFGLYYLLIDNGALWHRVIRLLPGAERTGQAIASRFRSVTEALLLGTGLTAVLQGTVVGIAFAVLGLQPPVLWGFVTACVSVLPLLGSALVWLPGVGMLLVAHRPIAALVLTVVGVAVASNIDNVARLVVFRRVSGIHPMLTLIGAFAGVRAVGVIGAFLGPLILSFMMELVRSYEELTGLPNLPANVRELSPGPTSPLPAGTSHELDTATRPV